MKDINYDYVVAGLITELTRMKKYTDTIQISKVLDRIEELTLESTYE